MSKAKKSEKKSLVPRLRFPEFRDAGGWENRKLARVLKEHGLKSTGTEPVFSVSVHKGLVDQIEHLGRSFSASSTDHYNRVLPGDMVYTKSPTGAFPLGIIKQSKLNSQVIVSPLYAVFSPETAALGAILDAYFESPANTRIYLEPLVQKGAKNTININSSRFVSGKLPLPTIKEEQQKIADCLASLDGLIAGQVDKLDALKAHKKSLMQQLFPREGETVPRLRFPEFRGGGKWKLKPLGSICKVLQGYGFPTAMQGKREGEYPFCKVSDISKAIAESGGMLAEAMNYIDDVEVAKLRAKLIPAGSTVFAKIGEALRLNRRAFVTRECLIDNNVVGIKAVDGLAVDYFIYLASQLIDMNAHCGGAIPAVNKATLEAIDFAIPIREEQQKIAECFSYLDAVITAQAEKIDALKTHKKGLMQQLFPSPGAVSV